MSLRAKVWTPNRLEPSKTDTLKTILAATADILVNDLRC